MGFTIFKGFPESRQFIKMEIPIRYKWNTHIFIFDLYFIIDHFNGFEILTTFVLGSF